MVPMNKFTTAIVVVDESMVLLGEEGRGRVGEG